MVSLLSLLALLSFCMFLRLAKSNRTRHFPRSLMCIYLSLILENKYHSSMSPSMNEHFVSWIILMQIRHVQHSSSQASLLFISRITVSTCTYLLQLQLLFAFTFYIIPLSLPPPNTTEPSKRKKQIHSISSILSALAPRRLNQTVFGALATFHAQCQHHVGCRYVKKHTALLFRFVHARNAYGSSRWPI